jgi:hypothetical protein
MAAVICESVGSLCRGCSEIICLPCKACGVGCECLWELVGSAFFPYMFVTFALNIPPFALGLKSIMDIENCRNEATWMIVNGVCCLIHIIACVYIVHRVQEEEKLNFPLTQPPITTTTTVISASVYDSESKKETTTVVATPESNLEYGTYQKMSNDDIAPSNSWGRIHHIMCYDKGVAIYYRGNRMDFLPDSWCCKVLHTRWRLRRSQQSNACFGFQRMVLHVPCWLCVSLFDVLHEIVSCLKRYAISMINQLYVFPINLRDIYQLDILWGEVIVVHM